MSESRKKADWPIVVSVVLLLLLLAVGGAYIGCYFWWSTAIYVAPEGAIRVRVYDTKLEAAIFTPAAKVESLFRWTPIDAEFVPSVYIQ